MPAALRFRGVRDEALEDRRLAGLVEARKERLAGARVGPARQPAPRRGPDVGALGRSDFGSPSCARSASHLLGMNGQSITPSQRSASSTV